MIQNNDLSTLNLLSRRKWMELLMHIRIKLCMTFMTWATFTFCKIIGQNYEEIDYKCLT